MESINKEKPVPKLHRYKGIPEHLPDIPTRELGSILPGPSLIYIEGETDPPLFISVLLHGNEITSFLAIQKLIQTFDLTSRRAPRSIILFIGNIAATEKGLRKLDGEPDYNRIWNGGNLPEHRLAGAVLAQLSKQKLYAAVDIHNNTGKNPHYACTNKVEPSFINLAHRFSKTIVYFTEPHEVISMALSHLCPSVTLECGFSGQAAGINHVHDYLTNCLLLEAAELFSPPSSKPNEIFHTIAKITVPCNSHLGFGNSRSSVDVCFRDDLEELNFTPVPAGTRLGTLGKKGCNLRIVDNSNKEVTDEYIRLDHNDIVTKKTFIPSMFTRNETVIHQDCFGYIMEPYPIGE